MSPLYVSDLDGTLLQPDATLSPFSRDTLNGLLNDGMAFTVATARSVVSVQMMLAGLHLHLPIIEFNGAFLSDLKTGRHEWVNAIDATVAEDIFQLIYRFGCVPFVSTFNGTDDCVYYDRCINAGMQWYLNDRLEHRDKRWRRTDNLRDGLRDHVVCFVVIADAPVLTDLEHAIRQRHDASVEIYLYENAYSPGWYWLTIHDHRATKARAVRELQAAYGFADAELVVFGDASNDLKLFHIADRALAVANATPELKASATEVIGSNQDDSVARYLQQDEATRARNEDREISVIKGQPETPPPRGV